MKKPLIMLASVATLLLTSCQQGRNQFEDHFKEYTFKGPVEETNEIYYIENKCDEKINEISSVEIVQERYTHHGYYESSVSMKTAIKIKEDTTKPNNVILEEVTVTNSDEYSSGVAYKRSVKKEKNTWVDNNCVYEVITTTIDGKKSKEKKSTNIRSTSSSGTYTTYDILYANRSSYLKESYGQITGQYFIDKDDKYAAISSSKNKTITAVAYGNETKEYIVSTKNQKMFSISKDYYLTSSYIYNETSSNRDGDNGEWFNSEKLLRREYTSYSFKYEKREKASISSLNDLYKKSK